MLGGIELVVTELVVTELAGIALRGLELWSGSSSLLSGHRPV
jgi:hypothetical protein